MGNEEERVSFRRTVSAIPSLSLLKLSLSYLKSYTGAVTDSPMQLNRTYRKARCGERRMRVGSGIGFWRGVGDCCYSVPLFGGCSRSREVETRFSINNWS